MSRIKLEMPKFFEFRIALKVRIGDLNYGNHLSNDVYLAYLHEARVQYFNHMGYDEMDIEGCSVIMGDSAIVYKAECFYGENLIIEVTTSDFSKRSFDFYYKISKDNDLKTLVAEAKTGMVCFDYMERKTVNVPLEFINKTEMLKKSISGSSK